ncbi:UNVERIFIED_CONTAM: hypothetical protein GTU68_043895 [Idotea baltica]|nr:hypothetical protein [Idotea baltica]
MAKVTFRFEQEGLGAVVVENAEVDLSILDIAEDHDVHLNHNCGAVCACSTCHIYVEKGGDDLEEISDREEDFIDRATNPRLESRLGCQAIILSDDAEIEVTIPDQRGIIGHEH